MDLLRQRRIRQNLGKLKYLAFSITLHLFPSALNGPITFPPLSTTLSVPFLLYFGLEASLDIT